MRWIFAIITIWLVFVLSLSAWWMMFGMSNLDMLSAAQLEAGDKILRHQRMLFYEGSVLVLLQVLGGLGLFYFAFRMYQEKSTTEKFFASITHDLKTAIFRMQLQVENLQGNERVSGDDLSDVLAKTRRLHLHLENGLDSALGARQQLFLETIDISDFLSDLHAHWPELAINLKGSGKVRADRKALRSVFKNLLHNSFLHGQAEQVTLRVDRQAHHMILTYNDNGKEFVGDVEKLGKQPMSSEKGSGFGLYLVRFWLERMNGRINFSKSNEGKLIVTMTLPEAP